MSYQVPRVTIREVSVEGNICHITVELSDEAFTRLRPPLSPATLWRDDDPHIKLIELHRLITLDGQYATFETVVESSPDVASGDVVQFISWWTKEQLAVAQDIKRVWQRTRFEPLDAIATYADGTVKDVPGGWDHEHCYLNFEKIDESEPYGYTDGNLWLCEECYQKYIASGFGAQLGDRV